MAPIESEWPSASTLDLTQVEEQQILEHLTLVRWIAARVASAIPVRVELEDLVQTGTLGLIDAIRRYDPDKGIPFAAYARFRIRGAILDGLRSLDWASRAQRRIRKIAATDEETAAASAVSSIRFFSIGSSGTTGQNGDRMEALPPTEIPCNPDIRPDRLYERKEARELVDRALSALPERYRMVMLMYYSGDWSMREIGESLGVNESRISQIHKAALTRMKQLIEDDAQATVHSKAHAVAACA